MNLRRTALRSIALGLAVPLALAACGDDSSTDGASTSTTGTGTTGPGSSVTSAGGGDGGAPSTTSSSGGEAGQGGSAGGAGPSSIGGPCVTDDDCAEGLCLTELETGNPSGYCSRRCDPTAPDEGCPEGFCESRGYLGIVCIPSCDPADPRCRDAYQCRPYGQSEPDWACRVDCSSADDCPATDNCQDGRCILPESDCDDLQDDDADGAPDCGDPHCASDPICAGGSSPPGGPCDTHLDCEAGTFCMDEARTGWAHGMCVAGQVDRMCAEGSYAFYEWLPFPPYTQVTGCIEACESDVECRDGYACQGYCSARCEADAECASGKCRVSFDWLCVPPEVCNDGIDNDGYMDTDCYDVSCTAVCDEALASACAAAVPLPASAQLVSSVGQQSVCGGTGAGLDVFTFTAPEQGTLNVSIEAATPHFLGIQLDQCDGDLFICDDNDEGGVVDREFFLDTGRLVLISVSAAEAEDVGPYTIQYSFTP